MPALDIPPKNYRDCSHSVVVRIIEPLTTGTTTFWQCQDCFHAFLPVSPAEKTTELNREWSCEQCERWVLHTLSFWEGWTASLKEKRAKIKELEGELQRKNDLLNRLSLVLHDLQWYSPEGEPKI